MTIEIEWFRIGPKTELHVDITAGSLTLLSTSKLANPGDFAWNPDDVVGSILKNGAVATSLTINGSTGAITASAVSVATGDHIEIRAEATSAVSWPWDNRIVARRGCFFDVPAGHSTFDFDDSTNVMPIPNLDLAIGWDSGNHIKLGVKILAKDGASVNLLAFSRLLPSASETSTSMDINSSSVMTHTSSFTTSDITGDFEQEWRLKSGTGSTFVEDRSYLRYTDKTQVAGYPANFPTDQVKVKQTRMTGGLSKLGAPGQ